MRLLVADDDPSLQVALRMVLELAGHEVTLAPTASAARAELEETDFGAVLVDAGIPGSGVDLWEELRSNQRYDGRAILMSGDIPALGDLVERDDVLGKPFDYDALLARLALMGRPDPGV